MLRVRLPSQSSVRKTYKSADGEKTSGHAVDRGRQAGHGITTESMDVNLFEKVHGKRVDLRQQAEDKNEREAQEKDVSHVRSQGQLARGGKGDAEQGELNGTFLIREASSGSGVQDESKRRAERDINFLSNISVMHAACFTFQKTGIIFCNILLTTK